MPVPVRWALSARQEREHVFSIDGQEYAAEHTILLTSETMDVELQLAQPATGPVVPSVLRGFSAPVRLHDDLSVDELAILANHDKDGFNRYEACQRLAHFSIKQRLCSKKIDEAVEDALTYALEKIYEDTDLRHDYKSLCFSIPGQSEVEHSAADCDPVAVWQARQALQRDIGRRLSDQVAHALTTDSLCETPSGRALRNRCLYLGVAAGSEDALQYRCGAEF